MGNSQSNTRKEDYKIHRIVRRDKHSDWSRCYLDDYVPYRNGNYKHIDFEEDGVLTFLSFVNTVGGNGSNVADISEGSYIMVDIEWTKECSSSKNFSKQSVKNVWVEGGNNTSILEGLGGLGDERYETWRMRTEASERARFERQIREWQLEPPKK